MRISPSRREIFKQNIRSILLTKPRIDNVEIAKQIGLHRNTVSKLITEIKNEDRNYVRKLWRYNLKTLLKRADKHNKQLNILFAEAYRMQVYRRPSQLASITALNWKITKESYKEILRFIGIREDPKSLVQVNISK